MRYYLYILFIFIFSCEEIQENSKALPYGFLISEGWINFENGDLDSAEELFLDVLDFDEEMLPYYSAAYLGLGWIKLYQAKTLSGNPIDNFNSIYDLRVDARNYFILILEEYDNLDIPAQLISDMYAGLAYSHSLFGIYDNCVEVEDVDFECNGQERFNCSIDDQIYNTQIYNTLDDCNNSCEQFTDTNENDIWDQYCWDVILEGWNSGHLTQISCEQAGHQWNNEDEFSCLNMTETALEYSRVLLDSNPNYYFVHDLNNINANSIHLLRAQLYISLDRYNEAQDEISQIDFSNSSITFTLEDSYQDPYNSYDRYLYVGFKGNNNSKHYIPMETNLYYSCYYSCDTATEEEMCINGCEWVENVEAEEEGGICQGDGYNEDVLVSGDCESDCLEGDCEFLYYTSSVTKTFTPMLPCIDLIIDGITLEDQEVVQCLESFPTHTLEYKFAIQFPSSILEGHLCSENIDEIPFTIYSNGQACLDACSNGECQIVNYDSNNCQSQYSSYEFIDGIGCIDGYMYLMEEFEDDACLENGYRLLEIEEDGSSLSSSSSFGLCTSN